MISNFKKIFDSFKKGKASIKPIESNLIITKAKFALSYKSLNIGYLEFSTQNDSWSFCYSDEFKNQDSIAPIISFPEKNKIYHGKELWSFFSSRIPDNLESQSTESKNKTENKELIELLTSYGRKTITNPFDLSIT